MQFKSWMKNEAFFDYLKTPRLLVPVPVFKNPTSAELKNPLQET